MPRSTTTSDAFNAVAEPKRREIINRLLVGEQSVTDLVSSTEMTQPQVSKHLRVLREVDLVRVRKDGRMRWYTLNAEPLRSIHGWVTRFEALWDHHLAEVKRVAESAAAAAGTAKENDTTPSAGDGSST